MKSYSIISTTASPDRAAQKFGVRGHVRVRHRTDSPWRTLKAATCRRTPKGPSSDFVIPSGFVILNTGALYRNRLPEFINSDQRKDAVCYATLLASHITGDPNLHWN